MARRGVDRGRNGKGIVYVFAAGNLDKDGREPYPRTAHFQWANFDNFLPKQALVVCAVNANGLGSDYSTNGSNLLVCGPSDNGFTPFGAQQPGITAPVTDNGYVHYFGGTSAAAPVVSGVVALMLQANPKLTWRDIRFILARTARILPSMADAPAANWIHTAAHNPYTGGAYRYSTRYGFGLVDADAAVSYAERFVSVGGSSAQYWQQGCHGSLSLHGERDGNATTAASLAQAIPMHCGPDRTVEFLEIEMGIEVKVPLYRQPRLQASSNRPPASASSPRVVARRDERSIYKRAVDDPRGYTVYSITADPRGSSLLVQAPGVLFTVDDGASTHRVQQWLAARGLRARPIAGGAAFEVDGISGEKALDLANALYESKLVRHARPNWVTDSGRR